MALVRRRVCGVVSWGRCLMSLPIGASRLIPTSAQVQVNDVAAAFLPLGVDPLFMAGLALQDIGEPSPIQAAAIPAILAGHNSQGIEIKVDHGKTLAYLLPALTLAVRRGQVLAERGAREVPVQALVVAPSQELAMQIARTAQALLPEAARTLDRLHENRPVMVVGTPGRLAEFVEQGALRLHTTPLLVLDEADQLLAPQFSEDMALLASHCGKKLQEIADRRAAAATDPPATTPPSPSPSPSPSRASPPGSDPMPAQRQTVLVSATLSRSVLSKTASWCPQPQYVTAGGPAPLLLPPPEGSQGTGGLGGAGGSAAPGWGWGVTGWDGPASTVGPKTQGSAGGVEGSQGLVPCMPPQLQHYYLVAEGQRKVDALRRVVHAMGVQRGLVFMNWQQRLKDVQFKLVFHLELPSSASHYAHRAGRTGRMGAAGAVVSLVEPGEVWVVHKLAHALGAEFQEIHTAYGEMRLGPAPADLEDEDDGKSPGEEKKAGAASPEASRAQNSVSQTGDRNDEGDLEKGSVQARDGSASQPQPAAKITSTDAPGWQTAARKLAVDSAAKGTAAEAAPVSSPTRDANSAEVAKLLGARGARVVPDAEGEFDAVVFDEEDEIEMDSDGDDDDVEEEVLQQERMRAARVPRSVRRGMGASAAPGSQPKSREVAVAKAGGDIPYYEVRSASRAQRQAAKAPRAGTSKRSSIDIKAELQKELRELKAEKEAAKRSAAAMGAPATGSERASP
ncbi:hypothetical protein V8C86DRAFT_2436117 [Haematococcus lacustris]